MTDVRRAANCLYSSHLYEHLAINSKQVFSVQKPVFCQYFYSYLALSLRSSLSTSQSCNPTRHTILKFDILTLSTSSNLFKNFTEELEEFAENARKKKDQDDGSDRMNIEQSEASKPDDLFAVLTAQNIKNKASSAFKLPYNLK